MASANGASCAMCIKSPAILAECSPGDYQQRIRRFKIKRPFSLKIDIDQKEWPHPVFAEQLGCGAEPVSDLSDSFTQITAPQCCDEILRAPPNKSVCFIITDRKHANKIRASVAERRIVLRL